MGVFADLLQSKKTGDGRGAFTDLLEEGQAQGAFTDLLPTPEAAAQPVRPVGPRPVAGPFGGAYAVRQPGRLEEQTRRAWKYGTEGVRLDFLWDDVAQGKIPRERAEEAEAQFQKMMQEDPMRARNFAEGLWLQTTQMLPAMAEGTKAGLKSGVVGAGALGAIGAAIPLPEELATVPGAFSAGFKWGSVHYWAKQGRGEIYREALRAGVSEETAKKAAAIGGPLYAAVEFVQFGKLLPKAGRKGLRKILVRWALDTAKEAGEEGVQKLVTTTSETLAKRVDGLIDNEQVLDEMKDNLKAGFRETVQAAGPMALLRAPAAGVEIALPRGAAEQAGPPGVVREPGRRIPYEGEDVVRRPVPMTLEELKVKLGLPELPPAHRPLAKLQAAEDLLKAGGRTGLVNEHIRLYRQWQQMEPGAEQDEVGEQIYDMTRLINRVDGIADPERGRGFIPPEMAEVERLRIEREAAAQREAAAEGRKPRRPAKAQPWVEVPPRPWGTKVTRRPQRPEARPWIPGPPVVEPAPAEVEAPPEKPTEEAVKPEAPPAPAPPLAGSTSKAINEWGDAEREKAQGASSDLQLIRNEEYRYMGAGLWLGKHPWPKTLPKQYADPIRRMAGKGMVQMMWDRNGEVYYANLEEPANPDLLSDEQMTAVEKAPTHTKESFQEWWLKWGGWDWHEDPRTAVLEYLDDTDQEFSDAEEEIRVLEQAGQQEEANTLLDELDRAKVDPLVAQIQEAAPEAAAPAKPAWDYRMWGKGTAARMIDENGDTVRRIRSNLEGKTVLCENPKHARGIYRHGGLAIKPDGSRWAGEPAARDVEQEKEDARYRAELAKTTKTIRAHPLYQTMLEGRQEQAFTRTGGLRTIYVPKELASDVEAYAGEDRRKGLWRYITHDPKGGQHYDDWAAEIGLEDQGFDAALTRLQELYEAEHEVEKGGISEAAWEEAVRQGGDIELEVLAMKRSMLQGGQPFEAINQAIADYVHDFAEFGGQDLSAEDQAGIIEAQQIKGKAYEAQRRVGREEGRPPDRKAVAPEEAPHPPEPETQATPAEGQRREEVAKADTGVFGQTIFRPATGTKQGELGLELGPKAKEAVPIKPELAQAVARIAQPRFRSEKVWVPFNVRKEFQHFWSTVQDLAGLHPAVEKWGRKVLAVDAAEPDQSSGRGFNASMSLETHEALTKWAEGELQDAGGPQAENSATLHAKNILKWLGEHKPKVTEHKTAEDAYRKEFADPKSGMPAKRELFNNPDNPMPEMQEAWDQATKGRRLPGGAAGVGFPGRAKGHEIDRGRIAVSMEPAGKVVSAREIIETARRAFGPTIRGKATHKMRTSLGWYDPKSWGIRLKDVRSLTTAMHEIGHYIDWHIRNRWSLHPPSTKIAKELVALGRALYGDTRPSGGYKSEGWAEFLRMYLTGEDIIAAAPALTQWFTQEYLPKEPGTAKSLATIKGMIDQWRAQGAEQRIESQINRRPIRGSVRDRLERFVLWADTNWRDQLAPLRWAMKKAGIKDLRPGEDPYQLSVAFADKAPAKAREFVLHGTSDLAGNRNGPGLREVVTPVADQIDRFTRWMFAYRAQILWMRGINPGISKADAKYVFEQYNSPLFQQVAQDITDWNNRVLLYLQEAGGITGAAIAKIRELNPIYMPFLRAFAPGERQRHGGVGRGVAQTGQPVKRIKGSGREIIEAFEAMIQQTERIISTAQKIAVARAMAKLAERPGMASLIWKVPAPMQATSFSARQIKAEITKIAVEAFGLNPDELATELSGNAWDEILTVYTNAGRYFGKDNIVALVVNGERQFYEVAPEVYRLLESLDQYSLPWFLNATFGRATRTLRLGATGLSLSFGWVRNFIRDAMTFTVQAKHAKGGPVAAAGGVVQDILRTEPAEHFKRLGGKMSVQILQDRAATQRLRREMLATSPGRWAIHTASNPVNALREIFGVPEAGTRIAEFDAALKYANERWGKGSLDAAVYALNEAQDVTTNFTRHGQMAKILNQMIPFFNAAIVGPDKMLRTFRARPVATTFKAIACLTVPALLAWWRSKDEEWYRRLTDQEKANYLHFRIPGTKTIVRVPVPFELGYLFQSLPVAALDQLYRDDPEQVQHIFGEAAERSNPFDWPALVGPVIDVMRNRTWTGRPVITEAMKNTLPEDRYYPHTTELMKFVGRQLGYSPAQIEYIVDQYSGGLYGRSARAIDLAVGERAQDRTIADIPGIGTLFLREPYRPSEKIERFYDRIEFLRQKRGSRKITGREERERAALESYSRKYLSPLWKELRKGNLPEERKKQLYARMERILDRAERIRTKEK